MNNFYVIGGALLVFAIIAGGYIYIRTLSPLRGDGLIEGRITFMDFNKSYFHLNKGSCPYYFEKDKNFMRKLLSADLNNQRMKFFFHHGVIYDAVPWQFTVYSTVEASNYFGVPKVC